MARDLVHMFPGSRPSLLRVEWRSDGTMRLRIEAPGCPDAIVDLDEGAQRDLGDQIAYGAPER